MDTLTVRPCGRVYLIGAGPGDPELLTLKAVRALAACDVLLVDDLVDPAILAHARPDARIVHVGKRGGCRSTPQAFIERLMVRYARHGRVVGRVKGGNPFVFGRGGEEVETLRAAGVAYEVVGGMSSGVAVPATLGIPLTHRDHACGVTLVTGHAREDGGSGREADWAALARTGSTLVIYMGMRRLAYICAALQAGGMPPDTPACAIQNGTRPDQRSVIATLADLPEQVRVRELGSPAIVVVGSVVGLAGECVEQAAAHASRASARVTRQGSRIKL